MLVSYLMKMIKIDSPNVPFQIILSQLKEFIENSQILRAPN